MLTIYLIYLTKIIDTNLLNVQGTENNSFFLLLNFIISVWIHNNRTKTFDKFENVSIKVSNRNEVKIIGFLGVKGNNLMQLSTDSVCVDGCVQILW